MKNKKPIIKIVITSNACGIGKTTIANKIKKEFGKGSIYENRFQLEVLEVFEMMKDAEFKYGKPLLKK